MSPQRQKNTQRALVWSNILSEPLFTLYSLLSVIIYKGWGATAVHISLLTMLKPVVTVLSFYWSAGLKGRSHKLKSNVIWASIWMRLPFLLVPWLDSAWYLIAIAVNYMFFYRASAPAWLEILRRNLGEKKRSRLYSWSSALGNCEGIALAIGIGIILDGHPELCKWLFFVSALVGLIVVWIYHRIPVAVEKTVEEERPPLKELLIRPWRDSYQLIRERPDFARFQWGFMICGFGIMLIQPALILFIVDTLKITYVEIAAAISIAKGLGFAISSPLWSRMMERFSITRVASLVFLTFGAFPILLSFAGFGATWLYLAYFIYGIGQGGSHLVWSLSGPTFAGKEESSRYTGVGVVLAGIRGGIAPPLGGFLAVAYGSIGVFLAGGLLCFYSGATLLRKKRAIFVEIDKPG
ncbi:MAG TPA: MFS transporter [Chlamydiales bacterium]|nr:MFS transporter [Chlamydiales bacterium]